MSAYINFILGILVAPILLLHWLFAGKDFGHGKGAVLVAVMFLFGSAFFFD